MAVETAGAPRGEAVLVWSCGPVQEFIATARKGRDLWFGSWLLAEISRAAALRAAEIGGVETLVMPAPGGLDELMAPDYAVANKLLIRTSQAPEDVAEEMSRAARGRLDEVAAVAFGRVMGGRFHRLTADLQVQDLLETQWAAAPVESLGGFSRARLVAEALHTARKAERGFLQPTWPQRARARSAAHGGGGLPGDDLDGGGLPGDDLDGEGLPKSSLDGARESVIDDREFKDLRQRPDELRRRYGAGPSERLCGVGVLKRFGHHAAGGHPGARVQSTSHVASRPFRDRVAGEGRDPAPYRRAFDRYIQSLVSLGAELSPVPGPPHPVTGDQDGHVLYGSRLGDFVPAAALEKARGELRALFGSWRGLDAELPPEPDAYYAILICDGDRVGETLKRLPDARALREFSRTLEAFSASVRGDVEAQGGHTVYAGGDDVLALLPTSSALGVADGLRKAFHERCAKVLSRLGDGGPVPTMSAGICIAHHLDPLQDALATARAAEAAAKEVHGRDAFALTLARRSGAPVSVGGRWESFGEVVGLVDAFRRRALSRGLPYEIQALAGRLWLGGGPGRRVPPAARAAVEEVRRLEVARIALRKAPPSIAGDGSGAKQAAEAARRAVEDQAGDVDALAARLRVARGLAQPGSRP